MPFFRRNVSHLKDFVLQLLESDTQGALMTIPTNALVAQPPKRWWTQFACRVVGAARWFRRQSRQTVHKLHPDLRAQLKELPLLAVTQLAPLATPELAPTKPGKPVTVFVHGYGGSRGNFLPMQAYFRLRGYHNTISIGFNDTSRIETMADELRSTLRSIILRNQLPANSIDIVAHSLGGIISRVTLQDKELQPYIRNLVTLATPHSGSGLARYLDTPICRGLRPGSSLLRELERQRGWGLKKMPALTAFWTPKDCILIPADSAKLQGAKNIEASDCTHISFLLKPSVWDRIIESMENQSEKSL